MSGPVTIAKVEYEDIPVIHRMNNNAAPAVNELNFDSFWNLCSQAEFLIKAQIKGTTCGFLLVLPSGLEYASENYRWLSNKYRSFLYIDRVVVSPKYSNQGIGSEMYKQLFDFGSAGGWDRINCEVNICPMNEVSINFHKKHGFTAQGTQETEGGAKTVRFYTKIL